MSYATIIWSWAVCSDPFDTSLDGFLIVSTTPLVHVQVYYVLPRGWFWFNKVSYSNMGVCFQLVYNLISPQTKTLHLSPPRSRDIIFQTCFFCWSLCANDSQLVWKFALPSNATYPKHLPLEFSIGHVLVGVNSHGRCAIVAPMPQIAKLPKNHKTMVSRFVSCFE